MPRQNKHRTVSVGCKMTPQELQAFNDKKKELFGEESTTSDFLRFLVDVAYAKLATSKVEKRTLLTIDGFPVSVVE